MIRLCNLTKKFVYKKNLFAGGKTLVALKNIHLDIPLGQTTGIVGESGSGKSTLARILMGLLSPEEGYFAYNEIMSPYMKKSDWKKYRRKISMVFQDPYSSLNPRLSISKIIEEPLIIHAKSLRLNREDRRSRVRDIIEKVGMYTSDLDKQPRQFSGGQRQRIGIARSLVLRPNVIILDEPVSALDVSIQAQILNLLKDLKEEFLLTYIFIAHDLGVIRYISDRIVVLYLGQILEVRKTASLFEHPYHPYTKSLMDSIPDIHAFKKPFYALKGEIPSPFNTPPGCPFYSRCVRRKPVCEMKFPEKTVVAPGEYYFCHNPRPRPGQGQRPRPRPM